MLQAVTLSVFHASTEFVRPELRCNDLKNTLAMMRPTELDFVNPPLYVCR